MKKILILLSFIFILLTPAIYSQGSTATVFDTTGGWSPAGGYSPNYSLYYHTLLSNPGGRINLNTQKIDSLLNALIVYTDTTYLYIENDTLKLKLSGIIVINDSSAFRAYSDLIYLANADSTEFRVFSDLKYLVDADTVGFRTFSDIKYIEQSDTTSVVAMQWELDGKLLIGDTTAFRTFSDLIYLIGADTTNFRTFSDLIYLVGADTTQFRTFSDSKYKAEGTYLIPSDSTAFRTFSDLIYLIGADSTQFRTFSDAKYKAEATYLIPSDSTTQRTYSDLKYPLKTTTDSLANMFKWSSPQQGLTFDGMDDQLSTTQTAFGASDKWSWEFYGIPEDNAALMFVNEADAFGILFSRNGDLYSFRNLSTTYATGQILHSIFGTTVYVVFVANGDNTITVYENGILVGTLILADGTDINFDGFSLNTSSRYKGKLFLYRIRNNTLIQSEVTNLWNNGDPLNAEIPFKYRWGSQTLIVPSDDAVDDDTGNWTDVNGALTFNTDHYLYTVTTGSSVASFTDEAALTIGKKYKATVLVKDGTGTGATVRIRALTNGDAEIQSGSSITVDGTYAIATVEWVATETNNKVQIEIVAASVSDGETVLFKTIETNPIGAILNLRGENMGSFGVVDASSNHLNGNTSGSPQVLHKGDTQHYVDTKLSMTGNTTLTDIVPKGYELISIYFQETAGNAVTGGIRIGTSDGGTQVVVAETVTASSEGVMTLVTKFFSSTVDQTLYVQAVSAWNSASLDIILKMRKIN